VCSTCNLIKEEQYLQIFDKNNLAWRVHPLNFKSVMMNLKGAIFSICSFILLVFKFVISVDTSSSNFTVRWSYTQYMYLRLLRFIDQWFYLNLGESVKDVLTLSGNDDSIENIRLIVHKSIILTNSLGPRGQRLSNPNAPKTDTSATKGMGLFLFTFIMFNMYVILCSDV
jgi:hypothetical protein